MAPDNSINTMLTRTKLIFLVTLLAATATATLMTGCSSLAFLNVFVPSGGYVRTPDLPYASLARQKLDVYVPRDTTPAARKPVVVFFYGGNWQAGNRAEYEFMAEALVSRGNVVVVPDYRTYPEVLFPEFLSDAAQATRWVQKNIARFGGDPQRIFLMGHSAGAHIAAMLTLDEKYLEAVGMHPAQLRGMIGLAGPYDFLPLKRESLKVIFGPEAKRSRSQPINYVTGHNPPMLLMTGDSDNVVKPANSEHLAAKIKALGGSVRVIEYPDMGHTGILIQFAAPLRGEGELLQTVAEFVQAH